MSFFCEIFKNSSEQFLKYNRESLRLIWLISWKLWTSIKTYVNAYKFWPS